MPIHNRPPRLRVHRYPVLLSMFALIAFVSAGTVLAQDRSSTTSTPGWPGWVRMPLLSPEAKKAGVRPGGEGGQWPRGPVVIAPSDPNFMLLPIDVGGLYRTTDGGKTWHLAMTGWNARGANDFAIDPRNPQRVIGVGGNSIDWNPQWGPCPHGLYLSTDGAKTWLQVLAVPDGLAGRVTFDPTSYSAALNRCQVAYYASMTGGLFRSDDGGETWEAVSAISVGRTPDERTAPLLAVHPTRGSVYLGLSDGLHRSGDGGKSFRKVHDGEVRGLALVATVPDRVVISGARGILISTDSGITFRPVPAGSVERGSDEPIRDVTVSSADPRRMTCWVAGKNWNWKRYVSHDEGRTFTPVRFDNSLATLPQNVRNGYFAWHPNDPKVVFGLGGDWVTKSTDGGKTFTWWNNGNGGIMVGYSFGISPHDPDTVFLGFQDYSGAFSTDGGQTWNYRDVTGKGWGGHVYGGFAVDRRLMWGGDAGDEWGGKRRLRVSRDGGKTWPLAKGPDDSACVFGGGDVSCADPKNPNIGFASDWRTADKGQSWAKMTGCDAVYTYAPDGRLFGKSANTLVVSTDSGLTWKTITEVPGGFSDVAHDLKRDGFYFASEGKLKRYVGGQFAEPTLPRNQYGALPRILSVAVDTGRPEVVYCGGSSDTLATHATAFRSRDGGQTWENLTTGDGPHEVNWVRVHPKTGDAWFSGQCFGMWRLPRPSVLGPADPSRKDAAPAPRLPIADPAPVRGEPAHVTSAPVRRVGPPAISTVIRNFGEVDYTYGPDWKKGENVVNGTVEGLGCLRVDATEHGGAGLVLPGLDITPNRETHLALRVRLLPGNRAQTLAVHVIRPEADGGKATVSVDLTKFNEREFGQVLVPLPKGGSYRRVEQVQIQGDNWTPGAAPLRIAIAMIGTATATD